MSRPLTRTRRWAFSLLPLLGLLLLGELAGRVLEATTSYTPRRQSWFIQPNPYVRGALTPHTRWSSGRLDVRVNADGFRGPELADPKPPRSFRIFALGESSTFGWTGITHDAQAWPAILQRALQERHPDRVVEVVNAGVPGWTSVESRVSLLLRIARLEPDALLVDHGNNDLDWSHRPGVERGPLFARDLLDSNESWWGRLSDHSYVYLELRSRISGLRRTRGNRDDVDPEAMAMLRWNLGALIDDAHALGVPIAVATFAHGVDVHGAPGVYSEDERALGVPSIARWFEHLSAQGVRASFPAYEAMVRDLARGRGALLVEVAAAVPPDPVHHTDWCHLTERGNEVVAQTFFDAIERASWIGAAATAVSPATVQTESAPRTR